METTIRPDSKIVTLINVFTVEPENQQKLLDLLREGTETLMTKMTGWISTNFLAGKDGRRVVIYSQWKSAQDIEAMRQAPQMGPYFQRVAALAKMEAIACDVVHVLHA